MSRTALIIDNDENTVSQVNSALSPLGYSVSSASDATAGLEMANNLVPSVMLVNLATPGSNGLELCKTIHGTEELKDVPIILLTLREGKFDPVYVKLYGIVSFLKKPFDVDTLISLINEFSTAEPETLAEPVAEPAVETYEETAFAEPAAEAESFEVEADSFEDSDATVAMTVDDIQDEGIALEAVDADEGFEETVTLTDAESDLGDLQASFSGEDYAGEETVAPEESAASADESFDFASTQMADTSDEGQEDTGGQWGDISGGTTMDDSGSVDQADETWGGMGGDLSMADSFGAEEGESEAVGSDAFAAAEQDEAAGMDAGSGFDSDGTMAFDSGGESDFSAGAAGEGGFDSEGTMALDTGQDEAFGAGDSGDLDIGGFQASKDAAPSADQGFDMDDGADESAWGDGGIESKPDTGQQPDALFEEAEEAFSAGFEEEEEGQEPTGAEGFGEEISFEGEEAEFDDTFLEDTGEPASEFTGDDQDYTGLFEPTDEEEPAEEKKSKKKKKKRFKKGAPSKARRVLVLLLLLVIVGGGAFYFREMLPFEIPDIKVPDISFKMPDIKIPFIGKEDAEEPSEPAKRPEPKAPAPAPEAKREVRPEPKKPEPAKPAPVTPKKAAEKAPAKPVKKEPVAPKQKTVKAPEKKTRKAAPKKTSTGKFQKGFYYVQFGVFGNSRNAEILSSQLQRKGYPTLKRKITSSKGKKLTVVLLDRPYKTRGSAEKRARSITNKTGFDTAVYR
jgi:twitching motility two-component system response regulator PilG